jgi:hypothetical protein
MAAGEGLILFDPHGDQVSSVLRSIPPHRKDDLIYFDAFRPRLVFNPLEYVPEHYRSLAAAGLLSAFKAIWSDSWGPRLEHILRNAVLALVATKGSTLADVPRLFEDKAFRKQVTGGQIDEQVKRFWMEEYEGYLARLRMEAIAPIQNKVRSVSLQSGLTQGAHNRRRAATPAPHYGRGKDTARQSL